MGRTIGGIDHKVVLRGGVRPAPAVLRKLFDLQRLICSCSPDSASQILRRAPIHLASTVEFACAFNATVRWYVWRWRSDYARCRVGPRGGSARRLVAGGCRGGPAAWRWSVKKAVRAGRFTLLSGVDLRALARQIACLSENGLAQRILTGCHRSSSARAFQL